MEITYCDMPQNATQRVLIAEQLKELGVTSVQTYIFWNQIEKNPGHPDWSGYDEEVEAYQQIGLKWVPFIILGPYYTTPQWLRASSDALFFRCLEHQRDSGNLSIWNEKLKPHIDNFLSQFSDHYSPRDVLESVLLGVSGDYGEAIYPVFGNWPTDYHTHPGYWCMDPEALWSYRSYLERRYSSIQELNNGYGSFYREFSEVKPVKRTNSTPRQWLDFIRWYRESMNQWCQFWLASARKHFPEIQVYLCTGGYGVPNEGSDFSLQAKTASRYNAAIRITNESSDYLLNFLATRMVTSSGKFYNIPYGFEPCSAITEKGMAARHFNAIASGASQIHDYINNIFTIDGEKIQKKEANFTQLARNIRFLKDQRLGRPIVNVAVFLPDEQWVLNEQVYPEYFKNKCRQLRKVVDFDFLDERMIHDGALASYKYLIIFFTDFLDEATIGHIKDWVSQGGILISQSRLKTMNGPSRCGDGLLGITEASDEVWGIKYNTVLEPRFLMNVSQSDKPFISKYGYIGLDSRVNRLAEMNGISGSATIWAYKTGRGLAIAYTGPMGNGPDTWMEDEYLFTRLVADGLYNIHSLDNDFKSLPRFNQEVDDVYLTEFDHYLAVLNFGETEVTKKIGNQEIVLRPSEIALVEK